MKTSSVLSTLAVALPAFAAPAPATTSVPGSCPGSNRAELFSNNNIQYTISCGNDLSTTVIRTTQSSQGMQGCLTACDGTIGCTAVTFVPADSTGLTGTCSSRTTGAQHAADSDDVAVAIRLTPMPTTTITTWPTAAATSAPAKRDTTTFYGLAIRSGSDIQYDSVNANGTYFWLNRGSQTYTPASTGLYNRQNNTIFAGGDDTLYLDVTVPGGQQVYIDAKGTLRFTVPHSADVGADSKTTGFSISTGHLQYENTDFLACNLGPAYDNAYEIYTAYGTNFGDACLPFEIFVSEISGATAAYEYA